METLADRLKAEREARGLTQDVLAKKVSRKKHQSLISNLEAGTYKSSPFLPEIAYALGVHAMWLKTGIGPKEILHKLNTIGPPPALPAPMHAAEPPRDDSYTSNIVPMRPASPLLDELIGLASRMSDVGLQVLIYEAKKIDKDYPKPQANHAN